MPYSSPLARRSDPGTSAAAADRAEAEGRIDSDEWQILSVLREMPRGGTGSEIAARISERFHRTMTNVQVMRRMRQLIDNAQVFRRADPSPPLEGAGSLPWLKRDGQVVHFIARGDMPLFGE